MNFSAYIGDVTMSEFPKSVRDTIRNFVVVNKETKFCQYGMVPGELIEKADPKNLETAREHVKKRSAKALMGEVRQALDKGQKYILLLNDRIIDGHHFLAKAERAGVTSSLPVLDLTPVRFQLSRSGEVLEFREGEENGAGAAVVGAGVGAGAMILARRLRLRKVPKPERYELPRVPAKSKAAYDVREVGPRSGISYQVGDHMRPSKIREGEIPPHRIPELFSRIANREAKRAKTQKNLSSRVLATIEFGEGQNRLRDTAIGGAALAAGGGVAYAGYQAGKTARVLRTTATEATKTARNARRVTAGAAVMGNKIIRASRFIKRSLNRIPGVNLQSRVLATIEFSREEKKRGLHPVVGATLSGAASGAVLGAIPILRRGTKLKSVAKSVATGAGISGGIVGGGTLIGSRILGDPKPDEGAAYTKRAAVGGGIAGAAAGLAGGILAVRTRAGRKMLVKASKTWRPARWARKGGVPGAAAVGTVAGTAIGAGQGADEGQQVDSIRNLRKDNMKKRTNLGARVMATIEFAQVIGYEGGVPLTGKIARDRYVKKMRDEDLDRRDANILRAGAAGALAGLVMRGKMRPLRRALVGAGAGAGGVVAVRAATEKSKDPYGDRSREAKRAEALPAVAGLATAAVVGARRLRPMVRRRFEATLELIHFGRKDQARDAGTKQWVNPLKAYADNSGLVDDRGNSIKLTQQQLLNTAWREGKNIRKTVRRGGNLLRDVSDVAHGRPKVPGRKREWEKEWFRNTLLTAGGAGAVLAHAVARRKVPAYRVRTDAIEGVIQNRIKKVRGNIDRKLGLSAKTGLMISLENTIRLVELDAWANEAGWDVRDPRGKSVRVFAPGSKKRNRRPKEWHEKVENQRTILGGLGVAGTAAGLAGGVLLGRKITLAAMRSKGMLKPRVAPKSWQKPGYRTKKVKVVSAQQMRKMGEEGAAS